MNIYMLILFVLSVGVYGFAKDKNVNNVELILLVIASVISFVPQVTRMDINPRVIFIFVVPPLLFNSAHNLSLIRLQDTIKPVVFFGLLLTFVIAIVSAVLMNCLVGSMGIWSAVMLGAAIAPADAVSAVVVAKKAQLPDRPLTILIGESLINDAVALSLFAYAESKVMEEKHLFISNTGLFFLYNFLFAIVIGLCIALVLKFIVTKLIQDSMFMNFILIIIPFMAYYVCDLMHTSGIIGVVTAGFFIEKITFTQKHNMVIQMENIWDFVITLLEIFSFLYLGFQTRFILFDLYLNSQSIIYFLFLSVVILFFVVVFRIVLSMVYCEVMLLYHKYFARKKIKNPNQQRKDFFIIGCAGMRGVVTFATVFSIPLHLSDGSSFPGKTFAHLVALVVVLGTLLVQGSMFPYLIKRFKDPSQEIAKKRHSQYNLVFNILDSVIDEKVRKTKKKTSKNRELLISYLDEFRHLEHISLVDKEHDSKLHLSSYDKLLKKVIAEQKNAIHKATESKQLSVLISKEVMIFLNYMYKGIYGEGNEK